MDDFIEKRMIAGTIMLTSPTKSEATFNAMPINESLTTVVKPLDLKRRYVSSIIDKISIQ